MSRQQKLAWKWLSFFRVRQVVSEKGTYIFLKINETELNSTVNDNKLKIFYKREEKQIQQIVKRIIKFYKNADLQKVKREFVLNDNNRQIEN
jgi:shikimate kinase